MDVSLLIDVPTPQPVGTSCSAETTQIEHLREVLYDPANVERYRSKVAILPGIDCHFWTGAIMRSGHGRIWFKTENKAGQLVCAAHRVAYALHHGADALEKAEVLEHICDEPQCQNPAHLRPTTAIQNQEHWMQRRNHLGSPLRDTRGRHSRAIALRAAILSHTIPVAQAAALQGAIRAGMPAMDRYQQPLF